MGSQQFAGAQGMDQKIPEEFICPISFCMMTDPVVDEFGHTYERAAIEAWLKQSNISPLTHQPYKDKNDLKTNFTVKSLIESFNKNVKLHESASTSPTPSTTATSVTAIGSSSGSKPASKPASKEVARVKDKVVTTYKGRKETKQNPVDLVLVVDRSGSMDLEISAQDEHGKKRESGFSVMTVVKHAIKAIIGMMDAGDRLGLVTYNGDAQIVRSLSSVNAEALKREVDRISPNGSTNLYAGVCSAIAMMNDRGDKTRNPHIILLTDGMPTDSPAQGEVAALRQFEKLYPIHTFGFGNSLDSKLLYEIGKLSGGMFSFIPDGSMVGTVFINAVANIKLMDFPRGIGEGEWFSVPLNGERYAVKEVSDEGADAVTRTPNQNDEFAYMIDLATESVRMAIVYQQGASAEIAKINKAAGSFKRNPRITELLETINDQIRLALSSQYFDKWGAHYARSFIRALELQMKTNFKDVALSSFTSDLFEKITTKGDRMFNSMPAPKADAHIVQNYAPNTYVPVVSLASYNKSSNPCFSGDCVINTPSGLKEIQHLRKGDIVFIAGTKETRIRCVIKTMIDTEIEMQLIPSKVRPGGYLKITNYHPIMFDGEWRFPIDCKGAKGSHEHSAIYSLLLEDHHTLEVEGYEAVCFGHGMSEPKILDHHYYGTERVIDDLSRMIGWKNGLVILKQNCVKLDDDGMVVKMAQEFGTRVAGYL